MSDAIVTKRTVARGAVEDMPGFVEYWVIPTGNPGPTVLELPEYGAAVELLPEIEDVQPGPLDRYVLHFNDLSLNVRTYPPPPAVPAFQFQKLTGDGVAVYVSPYHPQRIEQRFRRLYVSCGLNSRPGYRFKLLIYRDVVYRDRGRNE